MPGPSEAVDISTSQPAGFAVTPARTSRGIGVTPYAAAQVTHLDLPFYAESTVSGPAAFALSYAAKSVTAPRTELGLRSDKSFAVGDALLTLRGRAAWAHDFNTERAVSATFQSLPGASFVVNAPDRPMTPHSPRRTPK